MLYRLIGEDGVGAWANLAGPWVEIEQRKGGRLLGFGAQALSSVAPAYSFRGFLARVRLELPLAAGINTQFLVESLLGNSEDHMNVLPAYGSGDSHSIDPSGGFFLRWQLTYELK